MRNIAIFVSGEGRAAERIIKLFNEGNRLKTVLLVVEAPSPEWVSNIKDESIRIVPVSEQDWADKSNNDLAPLLRQDNVSLIVLDDFSLFLSDEVMEAVNGEIIKVSSPEMAPKEVVAALEADLRKPVEQEEEKLPEEKPSLESEWADALKIQYRPPKVPQTPPELPQPENQEIKIEEIKEETPVFVRNENFYERRDERPLPSEPMPSTWLIWSILVAVFCCFIPGIIAIIFSSQVSSRYYAGDIEGARRASRQAEIWIIVSVVLGVLAATLYIPFMMIGW